MRRHEKKLRITLPLPIVADIKLIGNLEYFHLKQMQINFQSKEQDLKEMLYIWLATSILAPRPVVRRRYIREVLCKCLELVYWDAQ